MHLNTTYSHFVVLRPASLAPLPYLLSRGSNCFLIFFVLELDRVDVPQCALNALVPEKTLNHQDVAVRDVSQHRAAPMLVTLEGDGQQGKVLEFSCSFLTEPAKARVGRIVACGKDAFVPARQSVKHARE